MTTIPDVPHRWRRWRWAALVALLMLLALLAWAWPKAKTADAMRLNAQALQRSLQFSGRVQSRARVDLGSTLTGRVLRVQVREGDAVAAGAVLVELDALEWQAALAQAQASLRQAEARMRSQQGVAGASADAALAQAQASLSAAERELVRTRSLLAAQFVSPARLDEARRAVDIARAQTDAASANARANLKGGSEAEQVRAQWAVAQAAVMAAQARLAQASVRAPAAGRIIARQVEPGQIVQPGRALLALAVDGPTELVALVDERFLGQLAVGQRARVVADAYPGKAFDAQLQRTAAAVDAQRGAVEVTFGVAAAPAFLREDMTLSIEVVTGARDAALVLPLRALRLTGPDRATVNALRDGHVQATEVQLGLRTLDQVEVVSGLADGDAVLLDATLASGARVAPRWIDATQALKRATTGSGGADGLNSAMGAGAAR